LRLQKNRTKYDLCKFCFANRIVNIWNSLPSYVVSAETVNCFKTRFDRFWFNQDIIYNFRSEIHRTGSQSEITVKSSIFIRVGILVVFLSWAKRLFSFYFYIAERPPNAYGDKNLRIDGYQTSLKWAVNFGGLCVRKMGIATFWSKNVVH